MTAASRTAGLAICLPVVGLLLVGILLCFVLRMLVRYFRRRASAGADAG